MGERVDWVDVAKGICIIMVVMMHSTLGVEKAAGEPGWMGYLVEFARPFRMPDFFLIAGLFLARRIDGPWRLYLDRKVLHFVYFYVLWLTIQFAFKAPGMLAEQGVNGTVREYLTAFVEPWGTLWFIYHLALFLLVTRLLKNVPWLIVWLGAAALEIAPIHTGSVLIDEFASRYVYFYTGYIFARHIFALAEEASCRPRPGADWACALGGRRGLRRLQRLRRPPLRRPRARADRRARGGHARDPDRSDAARARLPLARRALDRDLPRLLPADGGEPRHSYEERHHRRCRDDLAARHDRRHNRADRPLFPRPVDGRRKVPLRAA